MLHAASQLMAESNAASTPVVRFDFNFGEAAVEGEWAEPKLLREDLVPEGDKLDDKDVEFVTAKTGEI